ncbi:MAG: carbohydrate ABC transporter permease [Clostridiales bacterium]|nr:carbohydrate ABC transporter permease [Clostridiales bacterium]
MILTTKKQGGRNRIDAFDIVGCVVLILFALIIFYPFYNAVLTSIVTSKQYILNPAMLYPRDVTLDNYRLIFENPLIWSGYKNTLIVVACGVVYGMGMTVCMAYAFSRKSFPGKRPLFLLVLFTMFFGGGLIPLYLLIKNMGLINELGALILINGVVPYYMIILKSGFEQIPESLEEAARIEGANDIVIFARVMLPLQMAMLATFTLFIAVDRWNDWFLPMLFIKEGRKFTLQVVLRSIIYEATSDVDAASSAYYENIFSDGIKIAAVVVTMLPIMCFYPFLQKHFVKGVLVGAVKM